MPTFGYETLGTTGTASIEGRVRGSVFTITEDGTADSITVALKTLDAWTGKLKCAIYLHSDLSLKGTTEERTITLTTTSTWYTFNFTGTKPNLTINTAYILVAWGQSVTGTAYVLLDSGDANQYHSQTITYNSFPNPYVPTHDAYKISIYCTYTPAGLPPPIGGGGGGGGHPFFRVDDFIGPITEAIAKKAIVAVAIKFIDELIENS